MDIEIDKAAEQRLTGFLDLIGSVLQYPQRRTATRSASRPERHFHDSFITIRLAFARAVARWLPSLSRLPSRASRSSTRLAAPRAASG